MVKKSNITIVFVVVFMISVAISSCKPGEVYKNEKHFPTRIGSGIR